MGLRIDALSEILRRYGQVFRDAWRQRHSLQPVKRTREELAFLPAQLELVETPLSPAPHWTMGIIMALFATALLWACLGQLDMVAVAPGKTVTTSRTKTVQPAETAVVRRILVQDGQVVRQGDLLIELDTSATAADSRKAEEALLSARLAAARSGALIEAMDTGQPPAMANSEGLPVERFEAARTLAASQYAAYQAKKQSLEATVAQKQAELRTVESAIVPLEQYLEISRARVKDYEALLENNYVPRQEYMLRKQERINAERDLAGQLSRREELRSAIVGAQRERVVTTTDTRRQWQDELRQAQEQIRQMEPELAKAMQRDAWMHLRAPVDGTVQQLAMHTVGGVVTPAQPLLSIVPENEPLQVEATVLNKDIGFVRPGQRVTVKIESFPYTRYGYLEGEVESISHDAIKDEKLGLIYQANIRLKRSTLVVDGVTVNLTPGMALSAEINTGKRRVIEFVLDPLVRGVSESMRER
ncbi:HlyD family type I secretion periplasmic adaptor subunit [Dyella sedimenti]|uniref:HlyD family type I secretion periplasmic adaptor subunit n=1 Tax=Dyella sedimenti TaxID=2919947 RepID=UPI00243278CE|nr:HlyD family type I secretion periplasmic adaptor subunit [Dyella sedimenti]